MTADIKAIIFDFGGVLVEWEPRNIFRNYFPDNASIDAFLQEIRPFSYHDNFAKISANPTTPGEPFLANAWFEGGAISMPKPLNEDGVTFSDGTKATIDQQAHDVVTFLAWTAEPKMEERKRLGIGVLLFLIAFAGVLGLAYKRVKSEYALK